MEEKTIWLKTENVPYRPFIHQWGDGSISLGIKIREYEKHKNPDETLDVFYVPLSDIIRAYAAAIYRVKTLG